jgi:uncharacterized protein DUF4403
VTLGIWVAAKWRSCKTACMDLRRSLPRLLLRLAVGVPIGSFSGAGSCTRFGPVYPPRPPLSPGSPEAEPDPARIVMHLAVGSPALAAAVDDAAPARGDGSFSFLGTDRHFSWERGPFDVEFAQGRIVLTTQVASILDLPVKPLHATFTVRLAGEPVVSAAYAVRLQSVDVAVTSTDTGLKIADRFVDVYAAIQEAVAGRLKDFAYDLRPLVAEASARLARPLALPVGDAIACARLRVLEIEAAPTVLAGGIEKDFAIVVAPSVTMPCVRTEDDEAASMPPLSNVAALTPGPFTVTVPIAARYDELTRAMAAAFTDGRLYFSTEYPALYLESPEVYESRGALVLKMHMRGPVRKFGVDADLDGDIYLVGHPSVVDNELTVPDLEPTIETRNLLLSLKAMTDGDRIRDDARKALRLDIGARLRGVTDKLGTGLTFRASQGCVTGLVDRVVVTGVYPHADYLRTYVAVTGRARATAPCEMP